MTIRVSCPFCNTGFDLTGSQAAQRATCPRCGEAVPVEASSPTDPLKPSLNGDGVSVAPASDAANLPTAPSGLRPLFLMAATLLTVVLVGIGVWLAGVFKPVAKPTQEKAAPTVRATWPPQTLAGLRYLPADSQIVFAVQPSSLLQYAERNKQDPNTVLTDSGMPKQILDWFQSAGIQPDQIDHVAVGVKFEGIPPFAVLLALREPLANEGQFLKGMQAKRDPDKNIYRVELGDLKVSVAMTKVDATKYLFAYRDEDLNAAKKPAEGIEHFRKDLQESIRKLSPSAFFWLATDGVDWTKNVSLGILAKAIQQDDLWNRFDPRLRATAVGVSLETELKVRISNRYLDSPTASEVGKSWNEPLTTAKGDVATEGAWVTATVPLNPTDRSGKVLKLAFTK